MRTYRYGNSIQNDEEEEKKKLYNHLKRVVFYNELTEQEEHILESYIDDAVGYEGKGFLVREGIDTWCFKVLETIYYDFDRVQKSYIKLIKPIFKDTGLFTCVDQGILISVYLLIKLREVTNEARNILPFMARNKTPTIISKELDEKGLYGYMDTHEYIDSKALAKQLIPKYKERLPEIKQTVIVNKKRGNRIDAMRLWGLLGEINADVKKEYLGLIDERETPKKKEFKKEINRPLTFEEKKELMAKRNLQMEKVNKLFIKEYASKLKELGLYDMYTHNAKKVISDEYFNIVKETGDEVEYDLKRLYKIVAE